MFERPRAGERAVLVQLAVGHPVEVDATLEFRLLAKAAGAIEVGYLTGSRDKPDSRLFIGSGKAEELKSLVEATEAELAIFDHALSPAQERNLERLLQCRVVERSGLILDIFAQRARSFEGKLQVELAQLRHMSTRLVRGWTHLERQKGGIGLRGPGETQLETDRRLLGKRIAQLKSRLARIETQRAQGRRARDRAEVPTVSLVGYTNAGKSTLFNRLTEAGVFQAGDVDVGEHAERHAGFHSHGLDAFDHGNHGVHVAGLGFAPGGTHAIARGAARLRLPGFGEHALDLHQL